MIETILKAPSTTVKHLEAKDGEAFRQWLTEWQASAMKVVTSSGSMDEVLRAQGKLEVLNRILGLKEEIRQYQNNARAGNVRKI